MKRTSLLAATSLALVVTACSTAASPSPAPPTATPAPSPSVAASATPSGDIVATAQGAGSFATLLKAADAAGLVETLQGAGPYTVFAPTDAAFASLPAGTLDGLLKDPTALKKVLLYHVVSGAVTADQVVGLTSATSVEGSPISIAVKDGTVVLDDTAQVTATDIRATNGVIHVIDHVLLPPDMTSSMPSPSAAADIVATATAAGQFTTLLKAAEAAGLVETLEGAGPYTVFAPTDDAFAALPAGTLDGLLKDPAALKKILLYHVVAGEITADKVVGLTSADSVEGAPIAITTKDGSVYLNGEAKVVTPDVMTSNGVIHVIDHVILPPAG